MEASEALFIRNIINRYQGGKAPTSEAVMIAQAILTREEAAATVEPGPPKDHMHWFENVDGVVLRRPRLLPGDEP